MRTNTRMRTHATTDYNLCTPLSTLQLRGLRQMLQLIVNPHIWRIKGQKVGSTPNGDYPDAFFIQNIALLVLIRGLKPLS